jgi:hypothetical protein
MPHRMIVLARAVLVVAALQGGVWIAKADAADQSLLPNTLTEEERQAGWILLFDGRTLAGWKASESGESFTVRDGMIVAHCRGTAIPEQAPHPKCHLFYVGPDGHASFTSFEFQADVKSERRANSGIYFHTEFVENAWPQKGFEVQIDNNPSHPKKTGSLYAAADVAESPARDNEWCHVHIVVCGKQVVIKVDGKTVVDWTEPLGFVLRDPPWYSERKLSSGTFALQAHDPDSTVYFKNIRAKSLAAPANGSLPVPPTPPSVRRASSTPADAVNRLRVIAETDAGGDPDDEQSLVRFLLYTNEWDVQGIIANRPEARDGENLNPERTGLGIVRRHIKAYGKCYPNLVKHDARYPKPEDLLQRTVSGYADSDDGVKLVLAAVDSDDPRPVWFMNWGTDDGSAPSSLKRALDQVLKERGPAGYAAFKNHLRLSGADLFGDHTTKIAPPFPIWVNTLFPEVDGRRWYHRFSAVTATAGGFDLQRDVLTGHGPLGALYPTNTDAVQKEGDTMDFLYLVPTGMNDPEQPTWGSWAGRYGRNENYKDRPYYWANQVDTWQGTTNRDNTLKRWAVDLQNDFKARMDWCVTGFKGANHPPVPRVKGLLRRTVAPGAKVVLEASDSTDPDQDGLLFEWMLYPEAGSYQGPSPTLHGSASPQAYFISPKVDSARTVHVVLAVTDKGSPSLTRYQRVIVTLDPKAAVAP